MVGRSFRYYHVHFNYYNYYFYAHTYSTTDEASDDVSSVCVCVIIHLVFPLQSPPDAAVLWYIDFKEYQRHYRDKV